MNKTERKRELKMVKNAERFLSVNSSKRVLCAFCNKPIHIYKLGGVLRKKGKDLWFCNNIICLLEAGDAMIFGQGEPDEKSL